MDKLFEVEKWQELLKETRQALSTLRAEDLEELAARAERIFAANPCPRPLPPQAPNPHQPTLTKLTRERRLLGDLMLATNRNLTVLRRLRSQPDGVDQRWVR